MSARVCTVSMLMVFLASWTNGQPIPDGTPFQVNVYTTSWQDRPSVASWESGYLVSWQSRGQDGEYEGVYARSYDRAGTPLTGEVRLNSFTSNGQGSPRVQVGPMGLVTVWRDGAFDGDRGSIMLKMPGQDEFLVNTHTTGNHMYPDLAMDAAGNFVVVWQNDDQDGDSRGVFGQRFSAAGVPVATEFQVNTTTLDSQDSPAIDGLGDGRFVVVWNERVGDDEQVKAQRFAPGGVAQGAEIRVNTPSYGRNSPDVAMAEDGSFVVVWRSEAGPSYEVFSRRFSANGLATTGLLPVATTPGLGGYGPSIRSQPSGDYLVLWEDGARDLRMRELGVDGVATSADAIVAKGFDAEVAFEHDGDLGLVTWVESNTDGDSRGVFARLVAVPFFADGFESGQTSQWSGTQP